MLPRSGQREKPDCHDLSKDGSIHGAVTTTQLTPGDKTREEIKQEEQNHDN